MKTKTAVAAATLAVVGTLPATATADPFTPNDYEFIAAVAGIGYSGNVMHTVDVARGVCALLDQGVGWQVRENFVIASFGADGPPTNQGYNASLFGQYAAYHYCPEHNDQYGSI